MSLGVSLCIRPLLLRTCPGVLAAFARSLRARIAWGVVGAARRAGIWRVAGPPRGVRAAVPGVRIAMFGVRLLPGVGPVLEARRKGVIGFGITPANCRSYKRT